MSRTALRASQLHKSYSGGKGRRPVQALDGLSFDVLAGTIFGLLGPNGAGKSTTVKVLTTLTRADSGTAVVADIDVTGDPGAVRRRIGLVGQLPSTDPMATGRENLLLAARIHGLSRAEATGRCTRLLHRFGIEDAADRRVGTWSGGMSRKLDVAIGLVHSPEVLFCDEPTTGLDPEARAQLWHEIRRIAAEDGTTVLLTTHYLDEADSLADQVAIVDTGRIRVSGTPEELKNRLNGDSITVELAHEQTAARALTVLGRIDGGTGPRLEDHRRVRADAPGGARVIPAVLAALESAGLDVVSASVSRPSLDDVYLHHVGRRAVEDGPVSSKSPGGGESPGRDASLSGVA